MKYSTKDRVQLAVLREGAGLMMAKGNARKDFEQFSMAVRGVRELGPELRRITFAAPELTGFTPSGPDEYFGLLIPQPGAPLVLPDASRINIRAAVAAMPAATRPELRWYTVRNHRPEFGEIDVDFVLHAGSEGPGSRWAAGAEAGQVVGFKANGSAYSPPSGARAQLLVADETSLPALAAVLEQLPGGAGPVIAIAEVPGPGFEQEIDSPVPVRYLHRAPGQRPGELALAAVAQLDLGAGVEYAWLCGESRLATGARRLLVRERGVDRRRVMFSGYWKAGGPRG